MGQSSHFKIFAFSFLSIWLVLSNTNFSQAQPLVKSDACQCLNGLVNSKEMLSSTVVYSEPIDLRTDANVWKVDERPKLIKWGKYLTFFGVGTLLAGGVLALNASELRYQCTNGYCEGDPVGGAAIAVLTLGTYSTVAGVTLWIIGKKSNKKLSDKSKEKPKSKKNEKVYQIPDDLK